jgi:TRAP transporter TAXI family solute receptor
VNIEALGGAAAQENAGGKNAMIQIAIAVLSALAISATAAQAQVLGIATTPAGSFTNSVGAAVAKVIVDHAGMRATVTPQQSHGQEAVNDGSMELSLATLSDVQQYVTGTVDWEGKGPKKNIRLIARMVPITTAGYVQKDSPVRSLADLKGKRISVGYAAQKAVMRVVLAQLATVGLGEKDVQGVLTHNIVQAADDFAAGKTDAFWFALGSAKVKQVAAGVGGLRALPVPSSPEAAVQMNKYVPGSYPFVVQPSRNLDGITEPTPVMAYDVVLFTRADLADDTVYKIAKAVHENKKDMAAVFPALNQFEPEKMAKSYEHLEYHPGAVRFFKEKGQWPPKTGS